MAGRLLTPIDASPGRVLMVQGDYARQFLVVEEGEPAVQQYLLLVVPKTGGLGHM